VDRTSVFENEQSVSRFSTPTSEVIPVVSLPPLMMAKAASPECPVSMFSRGRDLILPAGANLIR